MFDFAQIKSRFYDYLRPFFRPHTILAEI